MKKIRIEAINPYDYVKDKYDNIFIVKCRTSIDNIIIGKLLYINHNGDLTKCKIWKDVYTDYIGFQHFNKGNNLEFILELSKVKEIVSPREFPIVSHSTPETLIKVTNIIKSYGSEVFLFGSRILNIDCENSDWDIIIYDCANPKLVHNEIIKKIPNVRCFNEIELAQRVMNYSQDKYGFNKKILEKMFLSSTLYLKSDIGEIGVFFANTDSFTINSSEILRSKDLYDVKGRIVRNNGKSYCMPREIEILTEESVTLKIVSNYWELSGLEELESHTVKFSEAVKIGDDTYWFGSESKLLEIFDK